MGEVTYMEQRLKECYKTYAAELANRNGNQQRVDYTSDQYYNMFKISVALLKMTSHYAKKNWDYFAHIERKVEGIMLYIIENNCESIEKFIDRYYNLCYLNSSDNLCVHAVIDGSDGKCYQVLPWEWKGSHCRGNMDDTHIAVVMWLPKDKHQTDGNAMTKTAYEAAVELCAMLCKRYSLNPLGKAESKSGEEAMYTIISQAEGEKNFAGCFGNNNPEITWKKLELQENTMQQFRQRVEGRMKSENVMKYEELFE